MNANLDALAEALGVAATSTPARTTPAPNAPDTSTPGPDTASTP
jgi:hypothetical protein